MEGKINQKSLLKFKALCFKYGIFYTQKKKKNTLEFYVFIFLSQVYLTNHDEICEINIIYYVFCYRI